MLFAKNLATVYSSCTIVRNKLDVHQIILLNYYFIFHKVFQPLKFTCMRYISMFRHFGRHILDKIVDS